MRNNFRPPISRRAFLKTAALSAPLLATPARYGAAQEKPVREDWPTFLGPSHNNFSQETGLLLDWPEDGPPLLWTREVSDGYGPPVVDRGHLVYFHRIGDEEIIECTDAETGTETRWRHAYPTQYVDQYGYNGGPRSGPCIYGEFVYTFGAEGVLTCVELATGERLWQRQVNKDFNVPQGFFGAGTTPVVDSGLVFLNVGGPDGAGVAAFDASNGETVWTASNDGASYSTPIVTTLHDTRMVLFHTAEGFLGVEAKTGKIRYQYPFRSELYESAIAATPVLVADKVFLSGTYHIGAVVLRLKPDELEVVWRDEHAMQNHWATSIYHDGYLYGMDGRHERGSNFRCVEFMTGEVKWTADEGLGRASFFMAEGHLFALGERSRLALIEVSPDAYKEKARARVSNRRVWTPPIMAQGRLYIRNEREIRCFDLREKA